jgi:Tfp pilus assembly protein PilV
MPVLLIVLLSVSILAFFLMAGAIATRRRQRRYREQIDQIERQIIVRCNGHPQQLLYSTQQHPKCVHLIYRRRTIFKVMRWKAKARNANLACESPDEPHDSTEMISHSDERGHLVLVAPVRA